MQKQAGQPQAAPPKKPTLKQSVLSFVRDLAVALIAVLLIITFVFQIVIVDGPSMMETLQDGERMFVTKYQYLFGDPQRFDVVICHFPDRGRENFVKRVVGIPGDTVSIEEGVLHLDGEAIAEPYIEHLPYSDMAPVTLGEGEYFVMGDNRTVSHDSRYPDVGPLQRKQIIGKVRAVIWPLTEIRWIR